MVSSAAVNTAFSGEYISNASTLLLESHSTLCTLHLSPSEKCCGILPSMKQVRSQQRKFVLWLLCCEVWKLRGAVMASPSERSQTAHRVPQKAQLLLALMYLVCALPSPGSSQLVPSTQHDKMNSSPALLLGLSCSYRTQSAEQLLELRAQRKRRKLLLLPTHHIAGQWCDLFACMTLLSSGCDCL